jgi:heme-degrading monooxygenase HmoA
MVVTITSLKLKSLWGFFRLSLYGLKISRQTKNQAGFINMKNTGSGYLHYTMSCWQREEDAKNFARSGAHLDAMKEASKIAAEIRVYTFVSEKMPSWKEAKTLVTEKGKVFSYS